MSRASLLIPPVIVFLAVGALLVGARTINRWPIKPPPCNFKTLTGIPCLSCGGTRAFQAMARGNLQQAFAFNPLASFAVIFVAGWLILNVFRSRNPDRPPPTPKQIRKRNWIWATGVTVALLLNWIYLILYLK